MDRAVAAARSLVREARAITVLTGAGISTDSGIPDFRGPQGVWTKDPDAERTSTLSWYLGDPEVRRQAWQNRLTAPMWTARPNAGHVALVELERQGRLVAVLTQNIDGLHQLAGHDPDLVVELHGTAREVLCWSCGDRGPMAAALDRVRAGDPDPACERCRGILKSATVLFEEPLRMEDLERADQAARSCDLVLAVGTTLTVTPAADVVPVAVRSGAALVIVNGGPTAYDELADVVVDGPISDVLPAIVGPPPA